MSVRKMYEQLIGSFYKSVFSLLGGSGMKFCAHSSDYCLQRHDYIFITKSSKLFVVLICKSYLYICLSDLLIDGSVFLSNGNHSSVNKQQWKSNEKLVKI